MKSKKQSKGSDVLKNLSEPIQFLCFTPEDLSFESHHKDASKRLSTTEEFLTHVCSQYKALLELPSNRFWSTMAFNTYINRSLDSFLSFAKRPHLNLTFSNIDQSSDSIINIPSRQLFLIRELYRLIFHVYMRLAYNPSNENPELCIPRNDLIYDNWLLDLPKFLDLCSVYGSANKTSITKLIKEIFDIEPRYNDDFREFIKKDIPKMIAEKLQAISRQRKRNDLSDGSSSKPDVDDKEKKNLASLLDIVQNIENILIFFPKSQIIILFYDDTFIFSMEQVYLTLNSCSKLWKINKPALTMLAKIVNGQILSLSSRLIHQGITESNDKNKNFWNQISLFFNKVGKSIMKKDGDMNYKFLRKLMKYVDFGSLLQKAPTAFLKEDENQRFQLILMKQYEKIPDVGGYSVSKREETNAKQNLSKESQDLKANDGEKRAESFDINSSIKFKDSNPESEAIKIIEMTFGKK